MNDLLSVERDESALIWRGMDERLPVAHRSDCNPCAILQCKLVTAAPNGGGTLQHVIDIIGGGRR